jgi:hypothetical protein
MTDSALIAVGIILQVATFALGMLVGSITVKRKESNDYDNLKAKGSDWWHGTQVHRR